MCKWLNKTPIYTFYFFKWKEKFIEKQKLQNIFVSKDNKK